MVTFKLALQALIALQAALVDAEALPAPTGPHKIGRMSFHWKDDARDELETSAPGDKRELMVHLFYPADPNAKGDPAAYLPDIEAMEGVWKPAELERIKAMRTVSLENAPLPPGDAKYPLIIFAPGGGMKGLIYHALLEDLASHGWIVAAIDPPYNARRVRLSDGRVLGDLKPEARGWPQPKNEQEYLRFYQERIEHWARDVRFVIDQLEALDRGDGPFKGRLDLQRGVGVVGHSRGGQAAGTVRLTDPRVRGGINIDGIQRELAFQPVKGDDVHGAQPFLWMQKGIGPPPTEAQLKRAKRTMAEYESEIKRITGERDRRLGAIEGGALRVVIERPGISHIDFSDEPFWDGTMTSENKPGRLQTIADTRAWVRAFCDGAVRGEWADLKRLAAEPGKPQGDVTVYVFGTMWP